MILLCYKKLWIEGLIFWESYPKGVRFLMSKIYRKVKRFGSYLEEEFYLINKFVILDLDIEENFISLVLMLSTFMDHMIIEWNCGIQGGFVTT